MFGVLRECRMPSRHIPPAPPSRRPTHGATTGCAFSPPGFFPPVFVAQAKKGGSRRHGAKAVDVTVVKDGEDQEQLAALAPLIRRCAPPSPASGRRASSSGKREKGFLIRQAGEGLIDWSSASGRKPGPHF